jgi:acyl-coenzyme A synthetase/AMP-(fatty) acid ligase
MMPQSQHFSMTTTAGAGLERMVNRRGHRIELGEIECALSRHEDIESAAVVVRMADHDVLIVAFLVLRRGRNMSQIAMKRHCAATLPLSMVPDSFVFSSALPRTSTDKVDYQALSRSLEEKTTALSTQPDSTTS